MTACVNIKQLPIRKQSNGLFAPTRKGAIMATKTRQQRPTKRTVPVGETNSRPTTVKDRKPKPGDLRYKEVNRSGCGKKTKKNSSTGTSTANNASASSRPSGTYSQRSQPVRSSNPLNEPFNFEQFKGELGRAVVARANKAGWSPDLRKVVASCVHALVDGRPEEAAQISDNLKAMNQRAWDDVAWRFAMTCQRHDVPKRLELPGTQLPWFSEYQESVETYLDSK